MRLSVFVLLMIGYIIVLLSNSAVINFQFFMFPVKLSVSLVIFIATVFGVFLAAYFYFILRSDKELKRQIRKMKQEGRRHNSEAG